MVFMLSIVVAWAVLHFGGNKVSKTWERPAIVAGLVFGLFMIVGVPIIAFNVFHVNPFWPLNS